MILIIYTNTRGRRRGIEEKEDGGKRMKDGKE